MGDEDQRSKTKWKRRGVLIGVGIVGGLIVWLSHSWSSDIAKEITKEVGAAVIVAAIIGLSIDEALKNELIRDAFFAAFRYAFPQPLQKEILRISTYRLICERHHWLVKVEKIDDECVRVTSETKRRISNIGSSTVKIGPRLHMDEWGFKQERSEILECKMEVAGRPTINATRKDATGSTILFEGREVPIKPGGSFTMTSKWREIRRNNDMVFVNFTVPTINPEIEVQLPDGFKANKSFGAASEQVEEISTGREVVYGTYLPYHIMLVRWWPIPQQSQAAPAPK
jgi:hypothetical protein